MSLVLAWFLVGIAFFVCELLFPTLVVLFFGIGAWASALSVAAGASPVAQGAVFIVVSLASLLLLRKHIKEIFTGRASKAHSRQEHTMEGRQGLVTRAIFPGAEGEISVGGSFWRAMSTVPLAEGTPVRILGASAHNDLVLRVESTEAGGDFSPQDNAKEN